MTNILTSFHALSAGVYCLLGALFFLGLNQINRKAEKWLGVFYGLMFFTFIQLFLEGLDLSYTGIIQFLELPRWAIIPSFYFALSYMVKPSALAKNQLLHFVPFLIFCFLSIIYSLDNCFNIDIPKIMLPSWIIFIIKYFFFAQCIFYWIACFLLLQKHQKNIKQLSSFTDSIDLAWIRYFLIAMLLLIIIRALTIVHPSFTSFAPFFYFVGTIALAYLSITQRSIYTVETEEDLFEVSNNPKHKSEERFTLQQLSLLKDKVLEKTITEKIYLDPSITLSSLSKVVGLSSHDLSFILNNGLDKSFYQFINELRTEEAKRLLLSKEIMKLDMSGIATRAGFNSKTTFYNSFKKITGATPSEFVKKKI